ncbi:hypothetical protein FRUB_06278 [Fimbriiglobus ruber]|uniref:Uncharacterized protein n=1 Tax=Fimbriiglobus ruber TaxID=1908690 RepID=A0A225DNY8_9BACT|nr:hypothetical protein FRUB_06278 [Fimbriiglobus ruber]
MEASEGYADGVVSVEQLVATIGLAQEAVSYAYHRRGQHFFTAASAVLFAVVPTGDSLPPNWGAASSGRRGHTNGK